MAVVVGEDKGDEERNMRRRGRRIRGGVGDEAAAARATEQAAQPMEQKVMRSETGRRWR
jgi:hypothetical protein